MPLSGWQAMTEEQNLLVSSVPRSQPQIIYPTHKDFSSMLSVVLYHEGSLGLFLYHKLSTVSSQVTFCPNATWKSEIFKGMIG